MNLHFQTVSFGLGETQEINLAEAEAGATAVAAAQSILEHIKNSFFNVIDPINKTTRKRNVGRPFPEKLKLKLGFSPHGRKTTLKLLGTFDEMVQTLANFIKKAFYRIAV